MGSLILCEKLNTNKHYYVENLGVNLYSGEELCYYIYNNLMLIDSSFFDENLLMFIEGIGYPELAKEIKNYSTVDYNSLLLLILRTIKYYNDDEINQFKNEIEKISHIGAEKVLKEKADHLFDSGRMYEAIIIYNKILSSRVTTDESLLSEVYRSLGNVHGRLYSYNSAIKYFLKSYELSGDINNLKSIYFIHKLSDASDYPEKLFDEINKNILDSWDADYIKCVNEARNDDEVLEVDSILDDLNSKKRINLLKYITIWKSEFKKIF